MNEGENENDAENEGNDYDAKQNEDDNREEKEEEEEEEEEEGSRRGTDTIIASLRPTQTSIPPLCQSTPLLPHSVSFPSCLLPRPGHHSAPLYLFAFSVVAPRGPIPAWCPRWRVRGGWWSLSASPPSATTGGR